MTINKIHDDSLPAQTENQDRSYDFSRFSHARVGIGHSGGHMQTQAILNFQAGYAQAKDAVFSHFDTQEIANLCMELQLPNFIVHAQAFDTYQFVMRPDLGRLISEEDKALLFEQAQEHPQYCRQDVMLVISGGLSPTAITHQVPQLLPAIIHKLQSMNLTCAPVMINPRGRVALGDQLNVIFNSRIVVMLIGERPGLTTPDSLGIYVTHGAQPGCTDDMRHCISNIHHRGLSVSAAVDQLVGLL